MKTNLMHVLIGIGLMVNPAIGQEVVTLHAGPEMKDAYVNSINSGTNYKDYPNYFAMTVYHQSDVLITRGLFDFNLSFIPSSAQIVDARLDLYFAINEFNPSIEQMGANSAWLCRITENWEEDVVTWDNMPQWTDETHVVLPQSTSPDQDYENIDVTQLVQDMVSNPGESFGFLLKLENEVPHTAMCFASSDYIEENLRPVLTITYLSCDPPQVVFTSDVNDKLVQFSGYSPTATTWSWDFGDGYGSSSQNPVHLYQEHGTYGVCLTVEDECWHTVICDSVVICDNVSAGFTWGSDGLVAFFNDTSYNATTYYWDFGDGGFSELQNPIYFYSQPGQYEVCLISSNSCSVDTACQNISVGSSGIKEMNNDHLISFGPNPAFNQLEILFKVSFDGQLTLFNQYGLQVKLNSVQLDKGQKAVLDTSRLPSGIYFLLLTSKDLQIFKKLVLISN